MSMLVVKQWRKKFGDKQSENQQKMSKWPNYVSIYVPTTVCVFHVWLNRVDDAGPVWCKEEKCGISSSSFCITLFFHVRRLKRIVSVNRIPPTRVLLLIDTELVSISLSVCIIQTALASKYITNTFENVDTFPKYLRESFKVKTIIVSLLVALMKALPHFKH